MDALCSSLIRDTQWVTSTPRVIAELNNKLMAGSMPPSEALQVLDSDRFICAWLGAIGTLRRKPVTVHERFIVSGEEAHADPELHLRLGSLSVVEAQFQRQNYTKTKKAVLQSTQPYKGPLIVANLLDVDDDIRAFVAVSYPLNNPNHTNRLNRAVFRRLSNPDDVR